MVVGTRLGKIAQDLAYGVGDIGGHDGTFAQTLGGEVACHGVNEDALSGSEDGESVGVISGFGKQGADQSRQAIARAAGGHAAVAVCLCEVESMTVRDDGSGVFEHAHGVVLA